MYKIVCFNKAAKWSEFFFNNLGHIAMLVFIVQNQGIAVFVIFIPSYDKRLEISHMIFIVFINCEVAELCDSSAL